MLEDIFASISVVLGTQSAKVQKDGKTNKKKPKFSREKPEVEKQKVEADGQATPTQKPTTKKVGNMLETPKLQVIH